MRFFNLTRGKYRLVLPLLLMALGCGSKSPNSGDTASASATTTATVTPNSEVTCQTSEECPEGQMCRGPLGCEDIGTCRVIHVSEELYCPGEDRDLCDCSGNTFVGNPSCPGRTLLRMSACDAPAWCVRQPGRDCDEGRPTCAEGSVSEYSGGCWHSCIPSGLCQCNSDSDCPAEAPLCDTESSRCAERV